MDAPDTLWLQSFATSNHRPDRGAWAQTLFRDVTLLARCDGDEAHLQHIVQCKDFAAVTAALDNAASWPCACKKRVHMEFVLP